MMGQLSSLSRSFLLPIHVESMSITQVATSTFPPCSKSRKFDLEVEMSFQLDVSKDNGGDLDTSCHIPACVQFNWI